jgi:hypothetical protein
MSRVALVPALLAALLAVPLACSRFSESGDTTDAGDPADTATVDAGSGKVERRVYVFGGVTAVPGPVPITSSYYSTVAANGDLGPWVRSPALDDNRYAAGWAQVGDLQIAAAGVAQTKPYSPDGLRGTLPHESADAAAIWKPTASMATGRNYAAALTRGTSVYLSGGKNAGGVVANIERYDANGDTWSAAGALKVGVVGHAMVARNSYMYVIGGDRLGAEGPTVGVTKAPFADDGSLGAFVIGGDLTAPAAYHSVALIEPWVFVIGGANASGPLATVTRGTFDGSGLLSWDTIASLTLSGSQKGLAEACAVVVDHTIYLIGGRDAATASSKGDVYVGRVDDHGVITWSTGPLLPEGRSALGCAVSPSSAP